jgi:hypothetical protein
MDGANLWLRNCTQEPSGPRINMEAGTMLSLDKLHGLPCLRSGRERQEEGHGILQVESPSLLQCLTCLVEGGYHLKYECSRKCTKANGGEFQNEQS